MKKVLFQGALLGLMFLCVWLAFSQFDFIKLFRIEKTTMNTEAKLGNMLWETIRKTEHIITGDSITKPVDKLITHLAKENGIDRKKIKLHIVDKAEVNAFAMPGNHLIVYTGLINSCDNESELAGVLGHEIAHMEKNHVMKKLVKEVGLSVLLSIAGGQNGATVRQAAKLLSSSAYDRKLESEADIASADYLIKANMDPEQFANLLYKMAKDQEMPSGFSWISTHPESEERAKAIVEYIKDREIKKVPLLSADEWKHLKSAVSKD